MSGALGKAIKANIITGSTKYKNNQEKIGEVLSINEDANTCTVNVITRDGISEVIYNVRVKLEAGGNTQLIIRDLPSNYRGTYTLELTGMSKVFGPAKDAQGNSCIKLGTSSKTGTFSFTVPENVNEVVIKVAKYKAKASNISVNGVAYTLNNSSDNGAYDEIKIDTTTTKTVTFETVSGGVRCMINSIAWVVTEE